MSGHDAVDVLAVMDREVARAGGESYLDGRDLIEARAAVAELIEISAAMLPRNVCLSNKNISNNQEIPLIATMGELRALAAALARCGGAQ